MKYSYSHSLPGADPAHRRQVALLKTTLSYNNKSVQVLAMIDSGADINVFNAGYAEILGIDFAQCEAVTVGGVGGVPYTCYKTEVELTPEGLPTIKVPILFIDSEGVDGLLGQEGFFSHHTIIFKRAESSFEVITNSVVN